jgi:hypothetical protein
MELVIGHLRDKDVLILLDNFEQLAPAARVLSRLLNHAPGLKLVVTSRSRLRLADEYVFTVDPLVREYAVRLLPCGRVRPTVGSIRRPRTAMCSMLCAGASTACRLRSSSRRPDCRCSRCLSF